MGRPQSLYKIFQLVLLKYFVLSYFFLLRTHNFSPHLFGIWSLEVLETAGMWTATSTPFRAV